jgi:hypothetical protein
MKKLAHSFTIHQDDDSAAFTQVILPGNWLGAAASADM